MWSSNAVLIDIQGNSLLKHLRISYFTVFVSGGCMMTASPAHVHPMPEFRDADHYRSPVGLVEGSHEIVRPKPRR